jgi:hypothetical protein
MYGKYICTQSCIFRAKIEKTISTQSFVVGSKNQQKLGVEANTIPPITYIKVTMVD